MKTGIVATSIVFLLLAFFIILFVLFHNARQKINRRARIKLQSQYQQELLRTQLEIQEQTLKNISQEIHDNIGQALTLAKLNLNTMPPVSHEVQEKIATTKELVSKAIGDLRDLSRSLNTDYIVDMGMQKALEYELGLISRSSSIKTNLQTNGEPFRMDKQKELILFRIVQEVLNNTIKHAGAKTIIAEIRYGQKELSLSISDDGKGFENEVMQKKNIAGSGLGLRNMQNRAKLIGAEFLLSSNPGKGTEVKIMIERDARDIAGSSFT